MGMNPPQFKLARSFFMTSAVLLGGMDMVWAIQTDRPASWRIVVGVLIWITIGVGLPEAWRWISRIENEQSPKPQPQRQEPLRSYPSAMLVIDAKDKIASQFHFLLENNGSSDINVLQVTRRTDTSIYLDGNVLNPRLIPPHDKLQLNDLLFEGETPGAVNLIVVYEAEAEGIKRTFTSKYKFTIRQIDLYPHVIYPSSREELTGKATDPDSELDAIPSALRQPVGSITFWCPEKRPDGQPNLLVISADSTRQIYFDPTSRVVRFRMMSKGRLYNLQRPWLAPKQGFHFVLATWDDAGNVHLYVDRSE